LKPWQPPSRETRPEGAEVSQIPSRQRFLLCDVWLLEKAVKLAHPFDAIALVKVSAY
jgi:hypothetical protein